MFGRIPAARKRWGLVLFEVGAALGFDTQEKLAACLGVTARTLRNWLSGRKPIDFEKIALCEPLRVAFFDAVAEAERAA
jgi:hypothetical protein